jgi:hypothetical protein
MTYGERSDATQQGKEEDQLPDTIDLLRQAAQDISKALS